MPDKQKKEMYDNLASLGDTPAQVDRSLRDLGFQTLRMQRSDARDFLNTALDYATDTAKLYDVKPPSAIERKLFIRQVLENNCVLYGQFHIAAGDKLLGCPLTLGYRLKEGYNGSEDAVSVADADGNAYPIWGSYFYGRWDDLVADYVAANRARAKDPTDPVLALGTTALVLVGR